MISIATRWETAKIVPFLNVNEKKNKLFINHSLLRMIHHFLRWRWRYPALLVLRGG